MILFGNVHLLDPANAIDRPGCLLVRDGKIAGIGAPHQGDIPEGVTYVDGKGAILCPGLIDMRVCIGEPGFEYRETIASAAKAAVAGGVTTMVTLPNNRPAIDNPAMVQHLIARGEETGMVRILPYAALTRDCAGKELTETGLLQAAGAVAFTDGVRALADTRLMRLALSYARGFSALVVQHPEDPDLARSGCATEGALATRMGLPSIPSAAESILIARDLRLLEMTKSSLHFAHVSTREGLELIRQAKRKGLQVTCDTAPPYFALTEADINGYRTYAKLSPPLRSEDDRLGVCEALADGTIDVIASDHMPRDVDDKRLPFAIAQAGGTGLVTLLAVTLRQVHNGTLPMMQAISLLTSRPAQLLGIPGGSLSVGQDADICLFDPHMSWTVKDGSLPGRSQNSPFDGQELTGRVIGTWKAGRCVFNLEQVV